MPNRLTNETLVPLKHLPAPATPEVSFDGIIAGLSYSGSGASSLVFAGSPTTGKTITTNFDNLLSERVAELHIPRSPASLSTSGTAVGAKSIDELLFDATAEVKILTAQVAMHLDREWRERLFRQLDSLHDPDEWDADDKPVQQASFSTFLKAICMIRPSVRPGLGLSANGQLVAAWTSGRNRLTIEFLSSDRVRWVVARYPEGELEQFAGQTTVSRLFDSLKPYAPEEWLFNAQ